MESFHEIISGSLIRFLHFLFLSLKMTFMDVVLKLKNGNPRFLVGSLESHGCWFFFIVKFLFYHVDLSNNLFCKNTFRFRFFLFFRIRHYCRVFLIRVHRVFAESKKSIILVPTIFPWIFRSYSTNIV